MSKKQLQVENITNELEGASAFFTPRTPAASPVAELVSSTPLPQPGREPPNLSASGLLPEKPQHPSPEDKNITTNERSNERTVEPSLMTGTPPTDIRTVERTNEQLNDHNTARYQGREKVRHSFDVFADQLISLKELAIEQEKLFGERVLIGDLVQQAIDMLITKERNL